MSGHRVFISHSHVDASLAASLCATLEASGIPCWIAPRNVIAAEQWAGQISVAVRSSQLMLVLVTQDGNHSEYVHKEVSLANDAKISILPVFFSADLVLSRELDFRLAGLHRIDVTTPGDRTWSRIAREVKELLKKTTGDPVPTGGAPEKPPDGKRRVVFLYKRGAQPDENLLAELQQRLESRGCSVFIDRHLEIGVRWAAELSSRICEADGVVILLSAAAVHSDMLLEEARLAMKQFQAAGKPRLLPVRVTYSESLGGELGSLLDRLQYFAWNGDADTDRLIQALETGLRQPVVSLNLPPPGGAMAFDSQTYVSRPTDEEFTVALDRGDPIVLVRGARQMGKTSLLARGIHGLRKQGVRVVLTDFQKLNADDLQSPRRLLTVLGTSLADQLDLDASPADDWRENLGASQNFERFLRRSILKHVPGKLVWALDEVDRLFPTSFCSDVFGLFRAWHNDRQLDAAGPFGQLTLAIAYATESNLFISDPHQSPFNVGTKIALRDFNREEVKQLNTCFGSPLGSLEEIDRFHQLLGGHPYLSSRGLHTMATRHISLGDLERDAGEDHGVFGDHLKRIVLLLAQDAELAEAARQVLRREQVSSLFSYHRLCSGGVMTGDSPADMRPRCKLYESYLRRRLLS